MALYVMADTHLSLSTDKPMDIFGPRWKNHHAKIEKNWRELVTDADTVVVPGDISWAMNLEEARADLAFLDALPGQKIIGRGNHDYWWDTMRKMQSFLERNSLRTIRLLYNNAYRADGFIVCGSRGWYNDQKSAPGDTDYDKIVAREAGRIALSLEQASRLGPEEKLVFLHFPPVFKSYVCREIVDVLHRYGIRRCYYGHIHTSYELPPSAVFEGIECVITSADYLNFVPLRIFPREDGAEI